MNRTQALSEWKLEVSSRMPHLSKPQAVVLALWSFGIVFTRSCGRVTVATFLALLLGRKRDAVEQQLYEWCVEARRKRGSKRHELDVTSCFVPLLRWMISMWGDSLQIALTLDATTLSTRFAILVVSVVYRGNAIPVAWTIVPATEKRAWRRDWLRMLRLLRPGIPSDWTVLVLSDRGLYARWLFGRIVRLGWHPFMRIKAGSTFRPAGKATWVKLRTLVTAIGQTWQGRGTCFQGEAKLTCTLVAWWGEGYEEPWFVITDFDPEACDVAWYGLRTWCEQGFKCTKRGGWQWQQTQMTDPERAARLWLAMAVASLWTISVGSALEVPADGETDLDLGDLPELRALLGTTRTGRPRRIRLFRLGWIVLLVRALNHQSIPMPQRLSPEPWPTTPPYHPERNERHDAPSARE
ncbi:hypothetical protein EYB53_025280 [Candidatus Chloroploca sp. M-50]|uniref:Transposase IS4-like domain-containing protein n=1 Tax=Candidatus Chloroploca mongolica TaxID=2528176 RepID=A0ABS4DHX6_9CHLR|nr:endonuclease [Candidatus Chloroploca mongolica]MBP1469044.1 hypothetical protein [Candidatus Chloroploca mongolica]